MADAEKSKAWLKKAADLNEPVGLCACGQAYVQADGVSRDPARGLAMIGQAAGMGSEHACYLLGWYHMKQRHGLKNDPREIRRYFQKMPRCDIRNSPEPARERAATWLRENPA